MIALVTQLSETENHQWLSLLNTLISDDEVKLLDTMTSSEKQACDIAVIANPNVDDLNQLPNLVWVQSLWAGVESLIKPMQDLGLPLVRLIDPMLSQAMAEAALAWTLYLHRNMPQYAKQQSHKKWHQIDYTEAKNRHVSILGLGALGQEAASVLSGQGFRVSGWSYSSKQLDNVSCYHGKHGLATMLQDTDILICLLPLTQDTRHLLGKDLFSQLPKGAQLINFARAGIIKQADLFSALDEGRLDHAVLDVFEEEPLPVDSIYWENEKITVLPHISAQTNPYSASEIVANNILHYQKTGVIPGGVNINKGY